MTGEIGRAIELYINTKVLNNKINDWRANRD
jgi:hypothetical protein